MRLSSDFHRDEVLTWSLIWCAICTVATFVSLYATFVRLPSRRGSHLVACTICTVATFGSLYATFVPISLCRDFHHATGVFAFQQPRPQRQGGPFCFPAPPNVARVLQYYATVFPEQGFI